MCTTFFNFNFEIELYYFTPAGLKLILAQAGLALVTFLPQPLEQQDREASVNRLAMPVKMPTPQACPRAMRSDSAKVSAAPTGLQAGSCGLSSNQVCLFFFYLLCFFSPSLSPLLSSPQRQYLLLISPSSFPNLVTSGS